MGGGKVASVAFGMCDREIPPLCPSPPHFTLQSSITISLPLSSLSERHPIQLIMSIRAPEILALVCVCVFFVRVHARFAGLCECFYGWNCPICSTE